MWRYLKGDYVVSEFELALQASSSKNKPDTVAAQTAVGRYHQEVMGMVFMAKQYPRDPYRAWEKIKENCQRKSLAEIASYSYPRGGENVSGPSIRLAEVIAQCWGNMSHGVVELEQKPGESTAMAFAWDLETNTRAELIFAVKHERKTKAKGIVKLNDPRDIYELVANMGARRKRACILAVVPKDVVENAELECDKTMAGNNTEPIADRVKKMLEKFAGQSVTREMIEQNAGYTVDKFTEKDILKFQKIYNSLKDNMAKREDFFEVGGAKPLAVDDELAKEFEQQKGQESDGLFKGDGNGTK